MNIKRLFNRSIEKNEIPKKNEIYNEKSLVCFFCEDTERSMYVLYSVLSQKNIEYTCLVCGTNKLVLDNVEQIVGNKSYVTMLTEKAFYIEESIQYARDNDFDIICFLPCEVAFYDENALSLLVDEWKKTQIVSGKSIVVNEAGVYLGDACEIKNTPWIYKVDKNNDLSVSESFFGQTVNKSGEKTRQKRNSQIEEKDRDILLRNVKFNDLHRGETCYILGNGPSLKNVEMQSLKDEFVISCNQFFNVNNYQDASTNTHVIVDSMFFGMREDLQFEEDELEIIWERVKKINCPVFVPLKAKEFIETRGIDKEIDIYYLNNSSTSIPNREKDYSNLKLDISDEITSYVNVVHFAIVLAIYMGFSKIKLLGCDTSGIMSTLNSALGNSNIDTYAYDVDEKKDVYKKLLANNSITDLLYWESFSFLGYQWLYSWCVDNNIELRNCSTQTLIDSIPREQLNL